MGKYGGKITSLLSGDVKNIQIEGSHFEVTNENINKFRSWWKVTNLEHLLVFWLGGVLTICLLSLLAYSTVYGFDGLTNGVLFLIKESEVISRSVDSSVGISFLVIAGLMLFNTQLTVLDATSRIMAENIVLAKKKLSLTKVYYFSLWAQIVFGIVIFTLNVGQPLYLLTISAVLNAIAMFIHIGLTLFLNMTELDHKIRPSIYRIFVIITAFLFFGYFSFRTIIGIFN